MPQIRILKCTHFYLMIECQRASIYKSKLITFSVEFHSINEICFFFFTTLFNRQTHCKVFQQLRDFYKFHDKNFTPQPRFQSSWDAIFYLIIKKKNIQKSLYTKTVDDIYLQKGKCKQGKYVKKRYTKCTISNRLIRWFNWWKWTSILPMKPICIVRIMKIEINTTQSIEMWKKKSNFFFPIIDRTDVAMTKYESGCEICYIFSCEISTFVTSC